MSDDNTPHYTALKTALTTKEIDELTYTDNMKKDLLEQLKKIGTALSIDPKMLGGKRRRRTNKRKGKGKKSRKY